MPPVVSQGFQIRNAARPIYLCLLLASCITAACASSDPEPKDEGSATDSEDNSTRGQGNSLDLRDVEMGSVSVVGFSDAVPTSNFSVTGFRKTELAETSVSCSYFQNGGLETSEPFIELEARDESDQQLVYLRLSRVKTGETIEFEVPTDESAASDLVLSAQLASTSEGEYRYDFTSDTFSYPTTRSRCSADIEQDGSKIVGHLSCQDLVAGAESLDAPVTQAPSPVAQMTLSFSCPLVEVDPRGEAAQSEPGECSSKAIACQLLTSYECEDSAGCRPGGDCYGATLGCASFFDGLSCEYQDGCYWTGFECKGLPESCYSIFSETACQRQVGCSWDPNCDGTPQPCEVFFGESSCLAQPGCSWD